MFRCYAFLSTCLSLIFLPVLLIIGARKKYRHRLPKRLGFGLRAYLLQCKALPEETPHRTCIWIHALSVGEVTSAVSLVKGLRSAFPQARLVFSVSTSSGQEVAERLLGSQVDALIPSPLDLAPIVLYFINAIRPDVFILVETDFWPNWLSTLARCNVPLVLVNGRISTSSFQRYQRAAFFFRPLFSFFTLLSMQTAMDADKMSRLGIPSNKIHTLGNLKFDTSQYHAEEDRFSLNAMRLDCGFNIDSPLWICGSTHRGEEIFLLRTLKQLRVDFPDLQMLLAPRNIERADELIALAASLELSCHRRSASEKTDLSENILILDTLGELAKLYQMADYAFIGGSLIEAGGHNPLEAAGCAVPVFFGPHMEDFAEIAFGLCQSGGAQQLDSPQMLYSALHQLLADPHKQQEMAEAGQCFVLRHQGVVRRHIEIFEDLLIQRIAPFSDGDET